MEPRRRIHVPNFSATASAKLGRPFRNEGACTGGFQAPDLEVSALVTQIGSLPILRFRIPDSAKALQDQSETVVRDPAIGPQLHRAKQIGKRELVFLEQEMDHATGIITMNRVRVLRHAPIGDLNRLVRPPAIHVFPSKHVEGARAPRNRLRGKLGDRVLPKKCRAGERHQAVMGLVQQQRADKGKPGQCRPERHRAQQGDERNHDTRRPQVAAIKNKRLLESGGAQLD